MSSKKQFTDSRWNDHPTLDQLKNNLSSIEKQKISKSEEKNERNFWIHYINGLMIRIKV